MTPKMTRMEAEAASEIPTPKPLMGHAAFVTTIKGPVATIQHNLHSPCVFVVACDYSGNYRSPKADPIDSDRVKLTFEEPWHLLRRRKVYKVVISGIRAQKTIHAGLVREREQVRLHGLPSSSGRTWM